MKKLLNYKKLVFGVFIMAPTLMLSQVWQMKEAALMTPWSETIDPENVLPEYPRPQKVRDQWVNLNGVWEYTVADEMGSYLDGLTYNQRILVPFPIESAISGIMDQSFNNPNKVLVYRRSFTIPESMNDKNILLNFGAVDWKCEVYINSSLVGSHTGGFDPFSFDITEYLNGSGDQEIQVLVFDPTTDGGQPHGKQDMYPQGIWYTPASGIWQTVWLEPVSPSHIHDFSIVPDVDNSLVKIKIEAVNANGSAEVNVRVKEGSTLLSSHTIPIGVETSIAVDAPQLWSPDSPFLYDLEFDLIQDEQVVDRVTSYFGMRKISLGKIAGVPCILLNNEPLFQFGVLDQGYWPDGIYTAPSDEALLFDLIKTKELGMNMTRKHIKVEPARWYYHCDRIGLLVWQDIINMRGSGSLGSTQWLKNNFYKEMKDVMSSLKNHPSIVTWVIFNEGWGQLDFNDTHTRAGVAEALTVDDTRLINPASGWTNYEVGDIVDRHRYPTPGLYANPLQHRASVCGEYGGITLVEDGHIWAGNGMEYTSVADSEELTTRFIDYAREVKSIQGNGLCGAVYTQITDVEEELNGLITYDRKVVKMDASQTQRVSDAIQESLTKTLIPVVPTSVNVATNEWRYSTNSFPGWQTEAFDDASWATGVGGFGNGNPPETHTRTTWSTNTIYLRRNVIFDNLTSDELDNFKLLIYYDEDFELYINGVLAATRSGYVTNYHTVEISQSAKEAIRINEPNLIAVRCMQTAGGQYIDVGFVKDVAFNLLESDNGAPSIIPEIKDETDFSVSPNPATSELTINAKNLRILRVDVCDLTGMKLLNYSPRDSYSIESLNKGMYILSASTDKGMKTAKFIKQ